MREVKRAGVLLLYVQAYLSLLSIRELLSPLGTRDQARGAVALPCLPPGDVRVEPRPENLHLVATCASTPAGQHHAIRRYT